MITIEFLGPIQKPSISIEAKSIREIAEALKADPDLADWLDNCAVAVNDSLVSSLDTALEDGDRVSLLPPVCGG